MIDVSQFNNCSLACIMLLIDRLPEKRATVKLLRCHIGIEDRTIQKQLIRLVRLNHLVQIGHTFEIKNPSNLTDSANMPETSYMPSNMPSYLTETSNLTASTGSKTLHVSNINKLSKVKLRKKENFETKSERISEAKSQFRSTENILGQVPAEQMPEFARTVHFVWKKLHCRVRERFSPDLIHRIAFALLSDEFDDFTNEWLETVCIESEAALKSTDIDKIYKRWVLIANRLKDVFQYHDWIWTSCRPVFKCVEAEKYAAKRENRNFRYELFPMEAERVAKQKADGGGQTADKILTGEEARKCSYEWAKKVLETDPNNTLAKRLRCLSAQGNLPERANRPFSKNLPTS